MILTLDFGNTKTKSTVIESLTIINASIFNTSDCILSIQKIITEYPSIKAFIISSVVKSNLEQLQTEFPTYPIYDVTRKTKFPFTNLYSTPETIGIDRLVLTTAAYYRYPKKNRLIIDAGSCVTFDFINTEDQYLGGSISPGLMMRYKAIHNFTENLPLLSPQIPEALIGDSTKSSIHSGIVYGLLSELDQAINGYKKKYPDLTIILTGGDCDFLAKQLKNSIFAHNYFLAEGLAALYYNVIAHDEKDHA